MLRYRKCCDFLGLLSLSQPDTLEESFLGTAQLRVLIRLWSVHMPIFIIVHVATQKKHRRGMEKNTILNGTVLTLLLLLDAVWESLCSGGTPSIP